MEEGPFERGGEVIEVFFPGVFALSLQKGEDPGRRRRKEESQLASQKGSAS